MGIPKVRPCKGTFCRACGKCLPVVAIPSTGGRYIPQRTSLMGEHYHLHTADEEEYW